MICPHCGEWAPDQASQCPHCQQPLDGGTAVIATSPEWPSGIYASPGTATRGRPIPSRNMIIASAMIASGAIGLLIFALLATGIISAHPSDSGPGAAILPTSTTTPIVTVTATPTPAVIAAINSGGRAVGVFSADKDVRGGRSFTTNAVIDTTGITDPAPQQVYQSARIGDFVYTISNLNPQTAYQVQLLFADFRDTRPGQRQFDVSINGQSVLVNFDIIAQAGGPNKALVKQFDISANSHGQISIIFSPGAVGSPMVNGIEITTSGS